MCPASTARVSELLVNWGQGDQDAREALIPLVYGELRRLARRTFAWFIRSRPSGKIEHIFLASPHN